MRKYTSYSELSTFSQCRKKWYWKYKVGIERDSITGTLARGIVGHRVFHLQHLRPDLTLAGCVDRAWNEFYESTPGTDLEPDDFPVELFDQFMRYYAHWGYNPTHTKHTELELVAVVGGYKILCYIDAIGEDENGLTVIFDRKFVQQFRPVEQFELSGQVAIYQEACRQNGIKVDGFVLDQINLPPKKPKLNKDGSMSRAVCGDWPTYKRTLIENGLNPDHYKDMEEKLPANSEFRRDFIYRNETEKDNYLVDLTQRIRDVKNPRKRIYMCDDRMRCGNCEFRELCLEQLKGGDIESLVQTLYRDRTHR